MGTRTPFATMKIDEYDKVFAINVRAVVMLTPSLPADDKGSKRQYPDVTTTMTTNPIATMANYAASKAAVYTMTRAWAKELAKDGVRVNSLGVGPIETLFTARPSFRTRPRKPTRIW